MKLDPTHLEILAAIVDAGGLSGGAASLGRSQPRRSRSLVTLEARLGSPLFQAGKRNLQPTEPGLRLAEVGRRILRAGTAASAAVQSYKAGAVRMGGMPIYMDGVIVAMIASFQRWNPDVRIEQFYGHAPDLSDRVRNGTLDLAICPLRDAPSPDLIFDAVLPGRNVIACRKGHPLMEAPALTEADLQRHA